MILHLSSWSRTKDRGPGPLDPREYLPPEEG